MCNYSDRKEHNMKRARRIMTLLLLAAAVLFLLRHQNGKQVAPDTYDKTATKASSPTTEIILPVEVAQEKSDSANEDAAHLWKDIKQLFTGVEEKQKNAVLEQNQARIEKRETKTETENKSESATEHDGEDTRPSEVCTNELRLRNVKRKCEQHPELSTLTRFQRHLKVDTKHNLLFCLVRKAGSTSIHNLMHMALRGKYMENPQNCGEECWEASGIRRLDQFSKNDKKKIIDTYHKIMVVRHPFERYVSCWVNKFKTSTTSLHRRVPGLMLIERIRGVPVNIDYIKEVQSAMTIDQIQALNFSDEVRGELAKEMSLSEMTKLVDLYEREKIRHDSHWRQMYEICQPCAIHYDYMVRVETMQFDSKHVLAKLNLTHENFPQLNHHRSVNNYQLEKDLSDFKSVPKDVMNTLHRLYATDLDVFGYSFNNDTFTAKCDGFQNSDQTCC